MHATHLLTILLATALLARADVLPPVQDSSSLRGKLTAATGKATTLAVSATRKGYVLFNLNSLPADVLPADIANARLRVYFPTVSKPGDINIYTVTNGGTLWDEKTTALEPGVDGAAIAMFPAASVVGKKFVEVDVTNTVRAWRAAPATNFGFAFLASGITNVLIGAKEGSGSGYPAELEVQIDRVIADGAIGAPQLADGAVTNVKLLTPSLTVAAGTGLSGGGLVALGGNVTLSLGSNLTLGGTTTGTFNGNGSALTSLSAVNLTGALPAISGAGLTSLNASNITSGTLADARLSGNVPLLNANTNTFTGTLNLPSNGLTVGTNQLVISGTNVGIGTDSNSSKLAVNGTIEALSGGIKFPDGSVQTKAAPGYTNSQFTCCGPGAFVGDIGGSSGGEAHQNTDGVFTTGSGGSKLLAPIQLPSGAQIVSVKAYVHDTVAGANLNVALYRKNNSADGSTLDTVNFEVLAGASGYFNQTFTGGPTINNTDAYYLLISSTTGAWPGDSTLSVQNIVIEWKMP